MSFESLSLEEQQRLIKLTHYEEAARKEGFQYIAGLDEAGRGPLAGPVVAAACIIPPGIFFPYIDDSKKLKASRRAELFSQITQHPEIEYGIGIIDVDGIDQFNILQATIQAMLMAVSQLASQPHLLLVDGMNLPHAAIPSQKIIKGDSLSQSIAAASILAKETRDRLMEEYDVKWPEYGFKSHKGYGTAKHLSAIEKYGITPIHRKSFEPIKSLVAQATLAF